MVTVGEMTDKRTLKEDNIEPDMQAIFMAHGPVAQAMKSLRKGEDNTTRQGWISTEPPVFQSESLHKSRIVGSLIEQVLPILKYTVWS